MAAESEGGQMKLRKVRQFSIPAYDKPGALGELAETLARAGVNLTAVATETSGATGFVRFVAEPEDKVRRALSAEGYPVFETGVFQVELADKPGELSRLAKALGAAMVQITHLYGTASGSPARLILAAEPADRAEPVLAALSGGAAAQAR
jgi:hypothetical protein